MTDVRTYKNSALIKINTPLGKQQHTELANNIMDWALINCSGCIELHPTGDFDNRYERMIVLCELAEDATLIALKWGR